MGELNSKSMDYPGKLYRIFGLKMASDYAFTNRLQEGSGSPDIIFTCVDKKPISDNWLEASPIYVTPGSSEDSESVISVHKLNDCCVVHFARIVDFYLWPDRIISHLLDPAFGYLVEIRLLGEIFSLWLELNDIPALHSSAVVVNGGAVAFLSTNHGGKSVLAATLMQEGYPLLTDDILPVGDCNGRFCGRAGYPQMRMWPDEAEYFLGHYSDLEIVHPWYTKRRVPVGQNGFGIFSGENLPLGMLYIPIRKDIEDGEIRIDPISPRDAVIELVRNSFSPLIVEALGLQKKRMELFGRLAMNVKMRKLIYPSGFHHLPEVREAIIDDIATI
jgi:hypothetical protein